MTHKAQRRVARRWWVEEKQKVMRLREAASSKERVVSLEHMAQFAPEQPKQRTGTPVLVVSKQNHVQRIITV